jgi:rifampicin phosphotransferase
LAPAPEVVVQIQAAVHALAPSGEALAVRSSTLEEDAADHSFAGQFESFLNVSPADVAARVVDVWRSAYAARALAYRREHGLASLPQPPAVLVQRMVAAEQAGIAFSADPVSGRRGLTVVAAGRGLGDAVAAGTQDADSYYVDRGGKLVKCEQHDPEQPVLSDSQIQAVAALTRRLAAELGRPQDIEWAWAGGQLFLLQARPITTLAGQADPDGILTVWDNSNIIESYGGMTTPLTYSFARRAYTEVYQEFCRILGVPQQTLQANQPVFANMIGLIQGRIYYNLLNWYRVLAMLPGFRANRGFMEQMMGVKESLPDSVAADLAQSTWQQRIADRFYLARTVLGLIWGYFDLERRKRNFLDRLERALGKGRPDMGNWRADELAAYYHRLDSQLLHQWDAPLINDFFAMIFFGLLRRLTAQWWEDEDGRLQNDLLTGEGGMISAEPAALVRTMAQLARMAEAQDVGLIESLRSGRRREIEGRMAKHAALHDAYLHYLERFGERCLNELKLESATLHDDPLPLLRAVGQLAQSTIPAQTTVPEPLARYAAEKRAATALAGKPLRRSLFNWVLRNARNRVRDRENLRFERTRVFGRARQIFRTLGHHLYAAGMLAAPEDVFYLEVHEILGYVEGTVTAVDLPGLAAVRKAEFARYRESPPPPSRFTTYGAVHQGNVFTVAAPEPELPSGEGMQGTGCCPGIVEGRARVVQNPLDAQLEPGDIIVAEHTDPSWIMIMPLAAGLLVERGSLLSHAAIVARELGIPAVVGLRGVTKWIQDGEQVVLDGSTGVVRRLGVDPREDDRAERSN